MIGKFSWLNGFSATTNKAESVTRAFVEKYKDSLYIDPFFNDWIVNRKELKGKQVFQNGQIVPLLQPDETVPVSVMTINEKMLRREPHEKWWRDYLGKEYSDNAVGVIECFFCDCFSKQYHIFKSSFKKVCLQYLDDNTLFGSIHEEHFCGSVDDELIITDLILKLHRMSDEETEKQKLVSFTREMNSFFFDITRECGQVSTDMQGITRNEGNLYLSKIGGIAGLFQLHFDFMSR